MVLSRVTIDPQSILMVNKRVKLRVGDGNGDLKNTRKRLVLFDEIGEVLKKMTLKWRKLDFDVVNFCTSTMLQNSSKCWGLFEGWVSFQCMFMIWLLVEGGIGVRCSLFHVSSRLLVLFARGF